MEKHIMIYLFHALVVGPALAYIAYARLNNITISSSVWRLILITAIVVSLYHGYSAYRLSNLTSKL